MSKLDELKKRVDDLYNSNQENRDEWADFLFKEHIYVVAEYAEKFSKRYGGDLDLAVAGAILHDIADAVMPRIGVGHEEKSEEIARGLLKESGYSEKEIEIVVDDSLKYHSCHNGDSPKTLEGKIVATADAIAHLTSYLGGVERIAKRASLEEAKKWVLQKIDRDLNEKIQFDDVREEMRSKYEEFKNYILNLS